jgi:phage FluMu gp28-like protein
MAAILPSLKIDDDAALLRYFMIHQATWITDESRMACAEKSVRIGWTYADGFKNVRKRLRYPNRNYLFATKDQRSAIEYMETCLKFAEIFDFTRSIISHGEEYVKVDAFDDAGKKFTEEVKFNVIKFDNGSKILGFSASPYAMAVFEGDVGLDEYAKHKQAEKLWETAQGRITWGYDAAVWSAHDGTDTLFYQFSREAQAGKGGWTHYKVTLEDAVYQFGLVEKINETRGTNFTREQFIADAKLRARLPEIYQQAYMCNPSGSTSAIVTWPVLCTNRREYNLERLHLEDKQVKELFSDLRPKTPARQAKIGNFIRQAFPRIFATPGHFRLGFDVAASGQGDLAAIYVDRKETAGKRLDALFTCRTDDWDVIETVLWTFMGLGAIQGAGDETGLGRQICWETAEQFKGRFEGVNFSGKKSDLGIALMNELSDGTKGIPNDNDDIAQDFFCLRKIYQGNRWIFTASRNALNPDSHGDIAWAGALASYADLNAPTGAITDASTIRLGGGVAGRPVFTPARLR